VAGKVSWKTRDSVCSTFVSYFTCSAAAALPWLPPLQENSMQQATANAAHIKGNDCFIIYMGLFVYNRQY
jgi:hypothetical protein